MKLRRRCWLLVNVPKWKVGGCVGWLTGCLVWFAHDATTINEWRPRPHIDCCRAKLSVQRWCVDERKLRNIHRPSARCLVGWRCTGNRINKNVYHHFELLGGGRKQQQKRTVDKCPLTRKQTRDALKSVGYCGIANGRGTQRWYRFTLFFWRTFNDSMDFLHSNQLQLCWFNFGKKCVVILGP